MVSDAVLGPGHAAARAPHSCCCCLQISPVCVRAELTQPSSLRPAAQGHCSHHHAAHCHHCHGLTASLRHCGGWAHHVLRGPQPRSSLELSSVARCPGPAVAVVLVTGRLALAPAPPPAARTLHCHRAGPLANIVTVTPSHCHTVSHCHWSGVTCHVSGVTLHMQ